ncbi:MAG TPA: hypothetical protein VF339_02020 [Gammaproteobacteria bacterium]
MKETYVRVSTLRAWMLVAALAVHGCATTYTTPGGAVSIPAITEPEVAEALADEPAATFPVRLIAARVQAPGYWSGTNRGYGRGAYSVVTARDIEEQEDFARLEALPGVSAVGTLNRMLLPPTMTTTKELRTAAARLRGDVLLLYTLDTVFRTDTQRLGPLQAVALGFFPNKNSVVTSTCSVAILDVRTGFVYGVAEASATEEERSNLWNTPAAIESARLLAERRAFVDALAAVERTWSDIYAQYGGAR